LKNLDAALHEQIPGFQLLEKLGQGSMGAVYKARQLSMDRLVAIKILQPKHARDPGYLQQFIREAHLAAKLSSNNIVQAIDAGSVGALHYFVMEYVEGKTIKDELETGKIYPETEAVEIILQVAQALEHAHRRRLIHRDVKPGNIILTRDGGVKLADLGLARLVEDSELDKAEKGLTIGTPYYIAPELIKGKNDADIRADIYSLGATLYHMVTGRPPFPGAKVKEVLQAHLHKELTPPDHINTRLSAGLGEVVEYMMAKDREQRYQTPAELILDLECLFRGEPPRLARQRSQLAALKNLTHGEAETASVPEISDLQARHYPPLRSGAPQWTVILAILLAISLLANLLLLAARW
jgi:serine/threonine protein kinase